MKAKLCIAGLILSSVISMTFGADWSDAAWRYRQKVTVNANPVGATLTDFPLLVVLKDPTSLVWTKAQPDGKDVFFTASDGTTRIPAEVEKLDVAGQRLWVWVRIPVLSASTATDFYMYYGNNAVGNQSDTNVWDSGYAAVYHLDESPNDGAPGHLDSTGNGNTGTPMFFQDDPLSNTDAVGIVDGANRFGGNKGYITVSDSDTLNVTTNLTVSFWMNPQELGRAQRIFSHWSSGGTWGYGLTVELFNSNKLLGILNNGNERLYRYSSVFPDNSTNHWHHLVMRYNGSKLQWFFNGVPDTSTTGTFTNGLPAHSFDIGYKADAPTDSRVLNGFLDEIRLSRISRSDEWIKACYSNQVAPEGFSSFAETEIAEDEDPNAPAAWPASLLPWSFRQRITVNSALVPGVLTHFPVVMTEANVTEGVWAHAQADGSDIRFMAMDGVTRISHEIEAFDPEEKRLTIWLGLPSLTPDANTFLYMYYGSSADGGADPDGVWTNNFSLVQHLNESSGTLFDSSPTNNHGTAMSGTKLGVEGWLGPAASFGGSNDCVVLSTAIVGGSKTYSCWLWPDGTHPTPGHVVFGDYQMLVAVDSIGRHKLGHHNGSNYVHTDTYLAPSTWHHLAVSIDSETGALAMYVDGGLCGTNSTIKYTALSLDRSVLGLVVHPISSYALKGVLDEARISTVVRTPQWIQASYANQSDPGAFLYSGEEEQAPGGSLIFIR